MSRRDERADELVRDCAVTDGGDMAQFRASTVQPVREEVLVSLLYAASFHRLVDEAGKHRMELCVRPRAKTKVLGVEGTANI